MCGIVGYLDKPTTGSAPIGRVILAMIEALDCRGPDSAGVALYEDHDDTLVLCVNLGDGDLEGTARCVTERVAAIASVTDVSVVGECLRLLVHDGDNPSALIRSVESSDDGVEVVSIGHRLEIIKQVGSPQAIESTYNVSSIVGTHGLGHTRMSTESRVDVSHSQPFWAHPMPDVSIVHNGHITNYHKMRRQYEQCGVRFYTDNDSEIIGIYVAEQLGNGSSLEEALRASLRALDGSFSYLVATENSLGFCRDQFAFKPLLVAETDSFVAIATEEIALRAGLGTDFEAREVQAKEVRVWRW